MIKLRTVQKVFLDKAEESRNSGKNKGLLILATGLGKTFASFCDAIRVSGKNGKILVLAHNHNLLHQHEKDFKIINDKKRTGFLYKSKKDFSAEVLFANIMTIKNKKYLHSFRPDEFDYIIIDETHHAGARSYKCIFDYFRPKFLLGMTATPTRSDSISIMPMYDDNIILEINTFDAISRGWLRKYKYVFLWDKWCDYTMARKYRTKLGYYKYDTKKLGRAYFVPERDRAIVEKFREIAKNRKGIGFCISVDESIRMADLFNKNGIKAVAVWGGGGRGKTMSIKERDDILRDFRRGKYQVLFNCEIIGEGLHFPSVDVVLKLRPTQSQIKDNQHNGRGLYNIEGLEIESDKYKRLLIIDWVGNYDNAYLNYINQGEFKKRLNNGLIDIKNTVKLPIGCSVEFEENVIEEFNKQINPRSAIVLQDAIKKYHQIYKTKPKRVVLQRENYYMYDIFYRNNLLDKYCLPGKMSFEDTVKKYHEIYKTKPNREKLRKENPKMYRKFSYRGVLSEYCLPSRGVSFDSYVKEYHKIYKEKPSRKKLKKENPRMYDRFYRRKVLDKYCLPSDNLTIQEAIKKYHKIYKEKTYEKKLRKENLKIYSQFYHHNLLRKYCLLAWEVNLREAIKEYHKIYKEKPLRGTLGKENPHIYNRFYRNNLLDKYCLPKLSKITKS